MNEPKESEKPDAATTHNAASPVAGVVAPTRHRGHVVISFSRIAFAVLCLAILAGGAVWWHEQSDAPKPVVKEAAKTTQPKAPIKRPSAQLKTVDATYLLDPKLLGNQNIFASTTVFGGDCVDSSCSQQTYVDPNDIKYYQIGTTSDGSQIVMIVSPTNGPGEYQQLALENGGKYRILVLMNTEDQTTEDYVTSYAHTFTSNVTLDTATKLAGLDFPTTLAVHGQAYSIGSSLSYGYFMADGLSDIRGTYYGQTSAQPTEIGTVGSATVYSLVAKDDAAFQVIEDYATFGKLFADRYNLQNSLLDPSGKKLTVNWKSGDQNASSYYSAASGCGTAGYVIAKNVTQTQMTAVGASADGQTLYQLPADAALSQELYNKDYSESKPLSDASLNNLTMQQFMDDHAYVLFKDNLGEYVVLQRSDMFITGGCAKPVIYLYPQQKTVVSVKVGARVTKSDPLYVADTGWRNVLAEPSGRLTYQGGSYNSLFWEGYGYGVYPDVDAGTVIAANRAVATIRAQLSEQGLNDKEITDFLAYWQPKLPTTPYVRLTWLSTAQINQLAPLAISPRPQTLIRVFLDFGGLQEPEKLAAQHFVAPARDGFTVVEWGGLARNGLR